MRCKVDILKVLDRQIGLDGRIFGFVVEDETTFERRIGGDDTDDFYNVVHATGLESEFPMPGQYASLFLPMGHEKSTMTNDKEFVAHFSLS